MSPSNPRVCHVLGLCLLHTFTSPTLNVKLSLVHILTMAKSQQPHVVGASVCVIILPGSRAS